MVLEVGKSISYFGGIIFMNTTIKAVKKQRKDDLIWIDAQSGEKCHAGVAFFIEELPSRNGFQLFYRVGSRKNVMRMFLFIYNLSLYILYCQHC